LDRRNDLGVNSDELEEVSDMELVSELGERGQDSSFVLENVEVAGDGGSGRWTVLRFESDGRTVA